MGLDRVLRRWWRVKTRERAGPGANRRCRCRRICSEPRIM